MVGCVNEVTAETPHETRLDAPIHLIEPVSDRIARLPSTRYYGSKRKLLTWMYAHLGPLQCETVLDAFGGTGSVSLLFQAMNKSVTYHDGFRFNEDVARTVLSPKPVITRTEVETALATIVPQTGVIAENFADIFFKADENRWLDGFAAMLAASDLTEEACGLLRYLVYQSCLKKRPFNLFHRANLSLRTKEGVERSFGNAATWERTFSHHAMQAYDELSRVPSFRRPAATILPAGDASAIAPGYDLVYIDPFRAGIAGFHGETPDSGQQRWRDVDVSAEMKRDSRVLYEFDLAHSPLTTLPSSWLTEAPELRHYDGLMWYQRTFAAPAHRSGRYFLRFGAANYATRVYLNGQEVGRHEGGFTPFAFDVTRLLRDGTNQITVGVDSRATEATVTPPVTDWENYGGITRPMRLIRTPDTYVDDAWIRLTRDGKLAADIHLDGPQAANRPVHFSIAGLVDRDGTTDANGDWRATMAAPRALVRWSPDRPQLYDVTVAAADDRWHDHIGFRTIERRGRDILLNGKPIFLKGISMHEEELGAEPTRAMTPAAARALLTEIKEGLHGNYVRLAHYPHTETTLRLADEMGLIVWSEIPVYWRVAWSNPATLARARTMLAENILRDRNRAAIAIWSVANETPVTGARNAFLRTLASDARRLDDTRLVSAALLVERSNEGGHPVMTMADPLADALDLVAINTYNGWYTQDRLTDLPESIWRVPSDKPLIFSEFGADARAGFHDSITKQKFSEEFQADYYRATLAMADRLPTLRGMSPWILKDFRSPRRQNPDFQQGWNRKGLLSETGERKQAFDVLSNYYANKRAVPYGAEKLKVREATIQAPGYPRKPH